MEFSKDLINEYLLAVIRQEMSGYKPITDIEMLDYFRHKTIFQQIFHNDNRWWKITWEEYVEDLSIKLLSVVEVFPGEKLVFGFWEKEE